MKRFKVEVKVIATGRHTLFIYAVDKEAADIAIREEFLTRQLELPLGHLTVTSCEHSPLEGLSGTAAVAFESCCENENRSFSGGCLSCGDPAF